MKNGNRFLPEIDVAAELEPHQAEFSFLKPHLAESSIDTILVGSSGQQISLKYLNGFQTDA